MTASAGQAPRSVDPLRLRLDDAAGQSGTLLGMRCRDCGVYLFGAATFCQACTSDSLEPVDLSPAGVLYSYTVVRVPPDGWPGPVPYVLGEVELPEGPHVLAEVIDIPEAALKIGLAVRLALREARAAESQLARIVYKWTAAGPFPEASGEA